MNDILQTYTIPGHIQSDIGNGGLPCFHLEGQGARATVYVHGAHVTAFQPADAEPVLWMSAKSHYADGQPLRGGVPICWPWFGPNPQDATLPAHGVARLRAWTVLSSSVLHDGRCQLRLGFTPEGDECNVVPAGLRLEYTITVGETLTLELDTLNEGDTPTAAEDALHSYFDLKDPKTTLITGLDGCTYLDQLENGAHKVQSGAVDFVAETDRIYSHPNGETLIQDKASGRTISIRQRGAKNAVVWNPWINKSKAMPDFGDDEWMGMCCVEAANCKKDRIQLLPGNLHRTRLKISLVK
ncbi:D-hexose-6-phosphate mutarotase [Kiritimatiellota bacterium B12222]|nr:D-hexose-6-phosphate mutarotase [Kiritimatiellota bacterium B12222]